MSYVEDKNPFLELQRTVRICIVVGAIAMAIVAIIAISGISLAWYVQRGRIQDNEELIVKLCRQNNAHNKSIKTVLLTFGVPQEELFELHPIICNPEGIKESH